MYDVWQVPNQEASKIMKRELLSLNAMALLLPVLRPYLNSAEQLLPLCIASSELAAAAAQVHTSLLAACPPLGCTTNLQFSGCQHIDTAV